MDADGEPPVLPISEPVTMPELPPRLSVATERQYKALSDPTRGRILGIILHRPATAKQIADLLGVAPGTIGHHLQTLEAAGLARVCARRLTRGIVAKYYARTARIFQYAFDPTVSDAGVVLLINQARDELADAVAERGASAALTAGYPRARLGARRAAEFLLRAEALLEEFSAAEPEPDGHVFGLTLALFLAPGYLQGGHGEAEDSPRAVGADTDGSSADHDEGEW